MALDENKAPQDEKEVDQENKNSFISSEKAEKLRKNLCFEPHSGQTEYFLNVYWDKYGKQNKDAIFAIFNQFVEVTNNSDCDVTFDQLSKMLPEFQKLYKITTNIPNNANNLLEAFDKLGLKHNNGNIPLISLLLFIFNETWIDTINLPVSKKHEFLRELEQKVEAAEQIHDLKKKDKIIGDFFIEMKKTEEGIKLLEKITKLYNEMKALQKEIEEKQGKNIDVKSQMRRKSDIEDELLIMSSKDQLASTARVYLDGMIRVIQPQLEEFKKKHGNNDALLWDVDQLKRNLRDAGIHYRRERADGRTDASKWFIEQCKKHNRRFQKFKIDLI